MQRVYKMITRKKTNITSIFYFLSILFVLLLTACAQISSPNGGKSDLKPPQQVLARPENRSVNFKAKKVEIEFNEYIQLNGLSEQLIISPPLKKTPDFKIKNKSIVFEIKDTLKDNTTYTFNFGSAISDITESNKIDNFQYVFSTGDVIDSLSISGKIKDALSNEVKTGFVVLLYKTDDIKTDSFFSKQLPSYFAKTSDKGIYSIKNLGKANYKLIALKDANSNYLFDNPEESIAFLDSEINLQESITDIDLFSFKEESKKTFLKNSTVDGFGKVILVLNKAHQNISVQELKPTPGFQDAIQLISKEQDSLTIWIPNQNTDSLFLKVLANGSVIDTVQLRLQKKPKIEAEVKKTSKAKATTFSFEYQTNIPSNTKDLFKLNEPIYLRFKQPIKTANFSGITLSKRNVSTPFAINFIDDNKSVLKIDAKFMADSSYALYIPKSSFIDVFDLENDSLLFNFTLQNPDNYGTIKLDISAPEKKYVLHFLTKDNKLIKQIPFTGNYTFVMDGLLPQSYQIKVIEDNNSNERWDTGNFYEKRQPEKIQIYTKPLDVRANWDLEEKWDIK